LCNRNLECGRDLEGYHHLELCSDPRLIPAPLHFTPLSIVTLLQGITTATDSILQLMMSTSVF
jgi:hypothetical protein